MAGSISKYNQADLLNNERRLGAGENFSADRAPSADRERSRQRRVGRATSRSCQNGKGIAGWGRERILSYWPTSSFFMVARILTYSLKRFLASTVTQNHMVAPPSNATTQLGRSPSTCLRGTRGHASRRDSRVARRGDANATHLASPGPSGTAWNASPGRDCAPCPRFPAGSCESPRETAHWASPSWTDWLRAANGAPWRGSGLSTTTVAAVITENERTVSESFFFISLFYVHI